MSVRICQVFVPICRVNFQDISLIVLIKCYSPKIHYLMNEESGSEKAIDNADGQFYLKNRFGSRAVLVQLLAKCILLKKR